MQYVLDKVIKYKLGHPIKGFQSRFHYRNFALILLCIALFYVLHIKNAYGQKISVRLSGTRSGSSERENLISVPIGSQ
jgi:hypothetical protein